MDINIQETDKFLQYHSKPNELNSNDLSLLKEWILEYPYCQSLHFLEAQAAKATPHFEESLAKAAAFASSRETLYQFIHQTQSFESEIIALDESEEIELEVSVSKEEEIVFETEPIITEEAVEEEDIEIEPQKEDIATQGDENSDAGFGNAFGVDLNNLIVSEDHNGVEAIKNEDLTIENSAPEIETIENLVEEEIQEENIQAVADENEVQEELVEVEETETLENPVEEEIEEENIQAIADENEAQEEIVEVEEIETLENPVEKEIEEENIQAVADENEVQEEIVEVNETDTLESPAEEEIEEENIQAVADENEVQEEIVEVEEIETLESPIEEEIQKENIQAVADENEAQKELVEVEEIETLENPLEEEIQEENPVVERKSREELFFDNPVSSDFFAFAKAEKPKTVEKPVEQISKKVEDENLAQYHDETLPYSFLWWLNKTRKEHAANTQPYVKAKVNTQKVEQNVDTAHLNHQIAENIFHLRGADEIGQHSSSNYTVPFDFRRKEYQIIEKFIKEEPQIKHPAPNKIDTENKAKKSSEDANEVVSETLAKIYVEQMLYHKALDVYKKLSLKYPEKSAYFASQIKYLELKVN